LYNTHQLSDLVSNLAYQGQEKFLFNGTLRSSYNFLTR